ncbi:40722f39-3acc-4307-81fb-caa3051a43a4 [Thermothielavioides terrestris]|uniref:Uncharacterized protein n=2 Tax=Thermothielavioides terrestris TaxID=2587410 RepID=G2QXD0_THETT|nr:uncharacterized protein THITE_2042557 [Thermothielavioides terrestris NRRL 8126]AEO63153.1 hypothetical protein THITE_2042557 [Thermothielavioides terrestris NRRL 8126]SPQ21355.1 40722f39-3acc-4307-81fb-caa3051a43a4 [Thermothielavioides terrestris]
MAPEKKPPRQDEAKYSSIGGEDHDDRSSTEVESLMEPEKQWELEEASRNPKRKSRVARVCAVFNTWRWLIDTTLLVTILVVVLRIQRSAAPEEVYELGGDITGFTPKFSQKIVKFEMDYDYAPNNISEFFTNPEVLDRWNKLMPKGIGFQEVQDPSKYHDLPTPVVWDEGHTVFTTSWTHQLHCLWAIIQTYAGLKSNFTLPPDHHWHMIHCFSYMRQAIICSADTALEGKETTFPDGNGGSDGWDAHHVCRDIDQVRKHMESVRAYDAQQIY